MSIGVGTAGSLVYLPANISGAPYSTLFGRPVIITEQCQTLGTTGDIILASLDQYCVIDKGSIQEDWSIHVMFIYDESVFRAVFRADGQPLWASAITPFKGSSTVSPFVCLQTRS
jgi:HK97 family phage major capsid protein